MADVVVEVPTKLPNGGPGPVALAVAMTIGPEWDAHVAMLRERSYERHVAAGHIQVYR